MKRYVLIGSICTALGVILGITAFKRLHQPTQCPVAVASSEAQTKTIVRYKDGKVEVKEIIRTESAKTTALPPKERPKNILGIQGVQGADGKQKVGPLYGRELFPNFYVTGGILLNTNTAKGKPDPAVTAGVQFQF